MAPQSIEQLRYYAGWADKIYGEGLAAPCYSHHSRHMPKAFRKLIVQH